MWLLNDNSAWLGHFKKMTPPSRERWLSLFDLLKYLGGVQCLILFVNGTNDFAYPLDSYREIVPPGNGAGRPVRHRPDAPWSFPGLDPAGNRLVRR